MTQQHCVVLRAIGGRRTKDLVKKLILVIFTKLHRRKHQDYT